MGGLIKVAPTVQGGYETVGGATQTLVLYSTAWDKLLIDTITPGG
ncbi:hypothetical protein NBRC116592_09900 [Colwellia sp. KU-HH00111]